ncbi:hypothetical protein HDU83_005796 [Entophlyctis luteolus]|nr:hypothetical protein HDU83_005796 [Entophlyctis luteolus]
MSNVHLPPLAGAKGNGLVSSSQGALSTTAQQQQQAKKRSGHTNQTNIANVAIAALEKKRTAMKYVAKMNRDNLLKDKALYRTERAINLSNLREMMRMFQLRGDKTVTIEDFKSTFGKVLDESLTPEQLGLMFMKIDANTDNSVDWDEFSTFILLREERQSKMREEASVQLFEVPNLMNPKPKIITPHHESVVAIAHLETSKKFVTASREGTVCFWSDKFRLQKTFLNVGYVGTLILIRAHDTLRTLQLDGRQVMKHVGTNKNNALMDRDTPWIHDLVHVAPLNKFAVASDNHEITFYSWTRIRFDLKDATALCLDWWHDADNADCETCSLFFGTDAGLVYTVTIVSSAFAVKNDNSSKSECLTLLMETFGRTAATKGMGAVSKRKAHDGWVGKVQYYHDLHAVVSCSVDPTQSLTVATQDGKSSWTHFSAPVNHGVNTFVYSRFPVALITGGTDHTLRLWNPHRLRNPMASFKGHNAPIIDLAVNEAHGQVISLSVDDTIKASRSLPMVLSLINLMNSDHHLLGRLRAQIWDIRKQTCLQTINDAESAQSPNDSLNRILFLPAASTMFAMARNISHYKLKKSDDAPAGAVASGTHAHSGAQIAPGKLVHVKTHDFPLRAAIYNPVFKQVITACDGGVVSVWDAFTGVHIFKFAETHGKSELTAIAFDRGHRKLITGGRDGTIFVWNFHNGQKIKELVKNDSCEVTDILQIEMHHAKYIVAVGWDRKVTLFLDDPNNADDRQHPFSVFPQDQVWHTDDIMCVAFAQPNVLATASYNGEIVLSNVTSGHLMKRLKWPDSHKAETAKSIEKGTSHNLVRT